MLKRSFDVCLSSIGIVLATPLLLLAALAIRLTSPGPILYRARRIGLRGEPFVMHKLRTMHHSPQTSGSPITGTSDPRIFPVGSFLRKTKIDELPQLFDVLRGKMSVVGPRPEDPVMVANHYGPMGWETLEVLPGLSSPGTLFHYLHADDYLDASSLEEAYVQHVLPQKLALDVEYVRRHPFSADLGIIARTLLTIALISLGKRQTARELVGSRTWTEVHLATGCDRV